MKSTIKEIKARIAEIEAQTSTTQHDDIFLYELKEELKRRQTKSLSNKGE